MARTSAELEEVIKEAKLIPEVVEVIPGAVGAAAGPPGPPYQHAPEVFV